MSEDFDTRQTAQNYAIIESLRHEQAWLEIMIKAHGRQIDDSLDTSLRSKLKEYTDHLKNALLALQGIEGIMDHMR